MSAGKQRKRRKLKSEINVVPYIDVMLVLLIIFMVTAPMLNLGVDIDLPESNAKSVSLDSEPVLISIARDGTMYLTLGDEKREAIEMVDLGNKVAAFVRQNPKVPVLVGGDHSIDYGKVYEVMVVLQQAGVPRVGLMSQPVGDKAKAR
ncbi:MAG TPA: protein TolR [Pseudomonadota bacterium]|nr:protein TolR [Rhodanobacteraceae bacterium]MBP9155147.1 protein TolR [Xanthomonadales bacterium]HQW81875.1 protein TolR [Pseudomonadota bacterium]